MRDATRHLPTVTCPRVTGRPLDRESPQCREQGASWAHQMTIVLVGGTALGEWAIVAELRDTMDEKWRIVYLDQLKQRRFLSLYLVLVLLHKQHCR